MAELKGIERMGDYAVEDIELSSMEEVLSAYSFIMADLREGLCYGVAKSLINSQLTMLSKKLGRDLPKVEAGMSAQKYGELIYPLLVEVNKS